MVDAFGSSSGRPTTRSADQQPAGSLRQRLVDLPEPDRVQVLLAIVRSNVAAVLDSSPDLIPAGSAFEELGFDSLSALELADRLAEETGLTLSGTLAFDYPTPAALAEHLLRRLLGDKPTVETRPNPDPPERTGPNEAVIDDLDSASADQVLELIRREFGGPGRTHDEREKGSHRDGN